MTSTKAKIIGITGGIATGKTTATNYLVSLGYKVIDADKVARAVVKKGNCAYKEIVKHFGTSILKPNGNINRKKLGKIIFNDKDKRLKLNSIVHPHVIIKIKKEINSFIGDILFIDIPLLIENIEYFRVNGLTFDEIWLVYLDEKEQVKRLMKRDKISYEDSKKRINAQMSIDSKIKYADKIIDNTKDKKNLYEQIEKLIKTLP